MIADKTSASSGLTRSSCKAFAGRRGPVERSDRIMLPMSFTDFARLGTPDLPRLEPVRPDRLTEGDLRRLVGDLLPYLNDLVGLWEAYLRVGGFPQAVSGWRSTGDVEPSFIQALWDVVYGGAINAERFSAPQTLSMLAVLTANMCSPLNVSDLARDVDAAYSTVKTRLSDLAESFMLWPCHREQGLMPKLNAQTKWYFSDPVLARLATVRGHGREPDLTQLNEQQLGLSLLRALDTLGTGTVDEYSSLMYYRSKTGSEIDFVGRGLGRAAVESKYVDDDRWGGTRQTFAATPWHGLIASRSATHWEDGISVIPAPILVLLIGG